MGPNIELGQSLGLEYVLRQVSWRVGKSPVLSSSHGISARRREFHVSRSLQQNAALANCVPGCPIASSAGGRLAFRGFLMMPQGNECRHYKQGMYGEFSGVAIWMRITVCLEGKRGMDCSGIGPPLLTPRKAPCRSEGFPRNLWWGPCPVRTKTLSPKPQTRRASDLRLKVHSRFAVFTILARMTETQHVGLVQKSVEFLGVGPGNLRFGS